VGRLEPDRSRRALCAALPLLAVRPLHAAERLPARNLIVELRLADAATVTEGAAAAGSISIDSRGHVRGGVGLGSLASTQRAAQGTQAVRVLNGGQARMQVVQTQALVGAVAAWAGFRPPPSGPPGWGRPPWGPPVDRPPPWGPPGDRPPSWGPPPGDGPPSWGPPGGQPPGGHPPGGHPPGGYPPGGYPPPAELPGGAVTTTWAELVDGFEVRPRWPGGSAPVTVEVGATRRAGASPGNAPPPRIDVFTTVLAPLGEWTELAQVQRGSRATVSTGGATVGTQHALQLQLRVTAAD
jgi:hypothetical protein